MTLQSLPSATRRRTQRKSQLSAVVIGVASTLLLTQSPTLATTSPPALFAAPKTQTVPSVEGVVRTAATKAGPSITHAAAASRPPVAPAWPTAASGSVTPLEGQRQTVAGTPFSITGRPAAPDAGRAAPTSSSAGAAQVTVATLDQQAARDLGVSGLLFSVARPAGTAGVDVDLAYQPWAAAYGGDWASRLRVIALPPCALSTPQAPGCSTGNPVTSRNNQQTHQLSLTLPDAPAAAPVARLSTVGGTAPASTRASATTLQAFAVTAAASGPAGSYEATTLAPSSSWNVGLQTGDFTWSYPLTVPPGLDGPTPRLSIDYSSGSVDGRTQSTNNQTSWVGEGHSLEAGYVERKYVPCADDIAGGGNNTANTGDLCWRTDNATINLGGHSGELVKDTASNTWKFRNDDGSKIEQLFSGDNGDDNHEMWALTTRDGTRYVFGAGRRGSADTAPNSNATWTVPVAGNQAGEPCHAASFAGSFCTQAWRWNLDYVTDPHGNSMSYSYTPETNNYGRLDSSPAGSTKVSYVRGGYLNRIEYGERAGSEQSTDAPAQVLFTTAERCLPVTGQDCQPGSLTKATAAAWHDVPFDLICADAATSCANQPSPSFFTRRRLTDITTQTWNGSSYSPVDTWTLGQLFPDPSDGSKGSLWLSSITHTGRVGGSQKLPDVQFDGQAMQNRVDGGLDGAPPMYKWRVTKVRLDTGGVVNVTYSGRECIYGSVMPAAEDTNNKRCFPAYFTPEGASEPHLDYFHKYRVDSITEDGATSPVGVPKLTSYTYTGDPAWHYDDNELSKPKYRTWSDWRGYSDITAVTGVTGKQTAEQYFYLRGMNGDRLKNGGARAVSITDTQGAAVVDNDRFHGYLREHRTLNGPTGAEIDGTINTPQLGATTASDGVHTASMLLTTVIDGRRTVTATTPTTVQRSQVTTTYNADGSPTLVDDAGDTAVTTDDTCTRTSYVSNPQNNLVGLVSRGEIVSVRCASTPARPTNVVSDVRSYYDGATSLTTPPTMGDLTRTDQLADWPAAGPVYKQASRASYDSYGRIVASYDALDRKTTTSYTPATGGPLSAVTTTNALGHASTTTQDAARGKPLTAVDANNQKTELAYDPLGRLTSVWLPNRPRGGSSPQNPSMTFGYDVRVDAPTTVTTDTLENTGFYSRSTDLLDGLLRPIQTQEQTRLDAGASTAGRVLSDTKYDERGLVITQNGPYSNSSPVSTGYFDVADASMPTQITMSYDGAGRPTASQFRSFGADKWKTTTSYAGDRVTATPPIGGTVTTTVSDLDGRTIELRQYKTGSTTSYDSTRYTYTPAGQLATVVDPAGNTWRHSYDLRGRRVSSADPDSGSTTSTFNDAGQLLTTTDGRNQTLATKYDLLGRPTELRSGSATGPLRASWTYDTLTGTSLLNAIGQPTSSTRYDNGNAYTSAVAYGYSQLGAPFGQTVTIPAAEGALAGTYTTESNYNVDGSLQSQLLPAAGDLTTETVGYHYDEVGNLRTLDGATSYVSGSSYNEYNEITQITTGKQGTAAYQTFGYEPGTHRLASAQLNRQTVSTTDVNFAYTYDPAGNLTKVADTGATTDTQCFTYDYLRRLREAWTTSTSTTTNTCATAPAISTAGPSPYWQSFNYDVTGNRTNRVDHKSTGNTTATYSYPAAGQTRPHGLNGISSVTGSTTTTSSFGYDAAGNTTSRALSGQASQTLAWDVEGKLQSVTSTAGTTSYLYDAGGERLIRRDPTATTLYLDGQELRLAKTSGATVKNSRFYSFNGQTVACRQASVGTTMLFNDPHGTAEIAITNSNNTITRRRNDPFGAPRGSQPTWTSDHGFLDGEMDSTGLTHLGAREYDPARGRFISPDPVVDAGNPQALNDYAYALNNPTGNSDPSGLHIATEPGIEVSPIPPTRRPTPPQGPPPANPSPANPRQGDHHSGYRDNPYVGEPTRTAEPARKRVYPLQARILFIDKIDWVAQKGAEVLGFNDAKDCVSSPGFSMDCANTVLNAATIPTGGLGKAAELGIVGTERAAALIAGKTVLEKGAEEGGRLLWTSWQNYPKVSQAGREYAQIGDRLYTRHAVDRMQPMGIGAPAGALDAGRSVSPNFIEDVLTTVRGVSTKGPAGEARLSYISGTVQVITEDDIVITVVTR